MLGWILQLVIETVVPIIMKLIQKSAPQADRATKRQWVTDALDELVTTINSKLPVPGWLIPEEQLLERLLGDAIDKFLDQAEGKVQTSV